METIRRNSTGGDGPKAANQYRELNTGELEQRQPRSPQQDRAWDKAAKGITNQHQKKVNMPFNHFVHPQSPPTIGSVSSHVTSSLRYGRLKSHLPPVDDFAEMRGILKQRYPVDSAQPPPEQENARMQMYSSTL